MRLYATLAMLGVAWGIGPIEAGAQDKLARLTAPEANPAIVELRDMTARRPDPASRLGLSSVEKDGIEGAVRGQIRALAARDAERAFGYLTPLIQDYFAGPKAFLATLTNELRPMMQARLFALAGLEREALDAIQHVVFTGADGAEWLAEFKVERQSDGSWRVKSCQVERARGQST